MTNLLKISWIVQLLCSTCVAVTLPRRQWTWRVLAGLSALADLVELPMTIHTHRYFYVYWAFRVAGLLWLSFATSHTCARMIPNQHLNWMPLAVSMAAVISAGRWENSAQMQVLQAFILIACAVPAWWSAAIFWSARMMPLALGLLLMLELACAFMWRYVGYHYEGWFIAWIEGMVMLWLADRVDRWPLPVNP